MVTIQPKRADDALYLLLHLADVENPPGWDRVSIASGGPGIVVDLTRGEEHRRYVVSLEPIVRAVLEKAAGEWERINKP